MIRITRLGALIKNPEILGKRLKSFAWELGNMAAVASLGFLADNLELVNLPPAVIGIIALILNQITKQINTQVKQ